MLAGVEVKEKCVLLAVLDSGSGIVIIAEAELQCLLHNFEKLSVQVVLP